MKNRNKQFNSNTCDIAIVQYLERSVAQSVRAWRFATVAACRAGSKPVRGKFYNVYIFINISYISPLDVGTLVRCVLGQRTLPSHASLDSDLNEYLVGQSCQLNV